jgi:hypothetical protein
MSWMANQVVNSKEKERKKFREKIAKNEVLAFT